MYSIANQVFAAELCCWQRIRCSLLNCGFPSESGFCCRIVLSAAIQVFAVEIMWSTANQVFATEIVLSAVNQVFHVELCCPQQFMFWLSSYVVRNDLGFYCQIMLFVTIQVFVAEFVWSAAI